MDNNNDYIYIGSITPSKTANDIKAAAFDLISETEVWDQKGVAAEKTLTYIDGICSMAFKLIAEMMAKVEAEKETKDPASAE